MAEKIDYMSAKEWFERSKKLHKKYKSLETLRIHCQRTFKKGYYNLELYSDRDLWIVTPNRIEEGGKPENHVFYIPFYKLNKNGSLEKFDTESKVAELTPILAEHIDRKELIKDVLRKLEPKAMAELHDRVIKHKAKIKQKPGCVYLSIGGKRGTPSILMLRD